MIFNLNTSLSKGERSENARRQACKGEVSRVCVVYLPHTVQDGLSQAERPNLPPSYPPQTNSFLTNSSLDKHQRRGKITSLPPNPLLSCHFSDWGAEGPVCLSKPHENIDLQGLAHLPFLKCKLPWSNFLFPLCGLEVTPKRGIWGLPSGCWLGELPRPVAGAKPDSHIQHLTSNFAAPP